MKIFVFILFMSLTLFAKEITPSEVYAEVVLIEEEMDYLLEYYEIGHMHNDETETKKDLRAQLKPRNVWQKSYGIMIKMNILRNKYDLPIIEPVNMTPVLDLNPDVVYEQTQRILTEIKIFKFREGIKEQVFKKQTFSDKTSLDVFNGLSHVSALFDELSGSEIALSYAFGENIRINDDITLILQHLALEDNTIPQKQNSDATLSDAHNAGIEMLEKIKQLQIVSHMDFVDFSEFKKSAPTRSDVFEISQMILAELQTLKAYLGIKTITPAATQYENKTVAELNQLMSWNLRKIALIESLNKGKQQ